MAGVCRPDRVCFTTCDELVLGELANRFQHREPRSTGRPVGDKQRLAHQSVQQVERGEFLGIRNRAGAFEIEAAGEHRTSVQQSLFRFSKQIVGPLPSVAQRLVAFKAASRTYEQPEPVVKTVAHLASGHRRHPGRCQLDGQRDAVESITDLRNRIGRISRKALHDSLSALDEKVNGRFEVQRAHSPHLLVRDAKAFATGSQASPSPTVQVWLRAGRPRRRACARSCRTRGAVACPRAPRPPSPPESCPVVG